MKEEFLLCHLILDGNIAFTNGCTKPFELHEEKEPFRIDLDKECINAFFWRPIYLKDQT